MGKLSGKVVIITGGGSWIGRAIATLFAKKGASCFLIGRTEATLKETVVAISELENKPEAHYVVADVNDEVEMQLAVKTAIEKFGKLDIVVINAAIYPYTKIEDISIAEWRKVIDTNLNGAFITLQSTAEHLKKNGFGRVIFVSSIGGEKIGVPNLSHYGASKAALNGLMRTAALELAPYGITVNSINPGNIMNTERFKPSDDDLKKMVDHIPVRRLGTPEDVAELALFLAGDKSGFVNAEDITIDGGQTRFSF